MNGFSGKLPAQAWMVAPETQKLMQALTEDGGDARFVGGCVRNALANRKVIDIDIATPLTPEQVIQRLKRHKLGHAPTGLKHGTVTAIVDGHPFEVTTLRVDVLTFGRHAEVKFTDDWKTDASRRDFTINAIFATRDGDIFDPFGGVEDLRLGRVRFVGDPEKRIREDVLRILRFFRFYAHFGSGPPDAAGLKACIAAAKQIQKLSAERIRQETLKLLEAERCPAVWKLMLQSGITTHFLPEATAVRVLENLVELEALHECPAFPLRRLAALLDVTASGLNHVIKQLKMSNEQALQLSRMAAPQSNVAVTWEDPAIRKLVYRFGNDMARNVLLLDAARSGHKGILPPYQTATSFQPPRFPLTGEDVLALGAPGRSGPDINSGAGTAPAGPEVGRLLGIVEDWWLEEDFRPDRAACLQKLQKEFRPETV